MALVLWKVTDFASTSALLNASTVRISGFGAPARTYAEWRPGKVDHGAWCHTTSRDEFVEPIARHDHDVCRGASLELRADAVGTGALRRAPARGDGDAGGPLEGGQRREQCRRGGRELPYENLRDD